MIICISHQKAKALANKWFDGTMPKDGDGIMFPTGAKLRKMQYPDPKRNLRYCVVTYTYDPNRIELAPLGL